MIKIDIEKYKINEYDFVNIESIKNKIVLTDSGRKSNYYLIHYLNKFNRSDKFFPTFTITRTGEIYQHFNPKCYSNFFDNEYLNMGSIIIMLENMGGLYQNDENIFLHNKLNERYDDKIKSFEKSWRNFKYFEPYPKIQQKSVIDLCKYVCNTYKINKDTIGYNVYNEDAFYYNGIISRSNINHDCLDLNPSFDFSNFIKEFNK